MKIVFDTNVLVAAFIARGTCSELLEYCACYHNILTSKFIIQEFRKVLSQRMNFSRREISEAERVIVSRSDQVVPLPLSQPKCRDRDDDWILSTALAGEAKCILTGDQDLLTVKKYQGIEILRPNDFWEYENRFKS